jgi:glycosyltransferase involved in cell wall biosynthesis
MSQIIHIIPNLSNGGAENIMVSIAEKLSKKSNQTIISLKGNHNDFLYDKATEFSEVYLLKSDKNKVIHNLYKIEKAVIICWLYEPIYWIYYIQILNGRLDHSIVWNIRNSSFRFFQFKQRLLLKLIGLASQVLKPNIIYCGHASNNYHEKNFFSKKKTKVIQNRLAKKPSGFTSKNQFSNEYYLYVGRYHHIKGPDLLIRVIKEMVKKDHSTIFLIVGSDWTLRKIPYQLRKNVKLLGNVKDIFPFYIKAKALILTSRSEGYPNVLVEATVMGCPVYALDAGDSKEILQHNAYGFVFSKVKHLIKKLNADHSVQFKNEHRYQSAQKGLKEFDFSKTVKEYEDFLGV